MAEGLARVGRSLASRWWDLERFGLSPGKLRGRLFNRIEPRVLCLTLPKSGSHLLERALCLHPRLFRKLVRTIDDNNIAAHGGLPALLERLGPGELLLAHLRWSHQRATAVGAHQVRGMFMVRDPRDVLVSQIFYVTNRARHPAHPGFAALKDFRERFYLALQGYPAGRMPPFIERLQQFSGWLDSGCLVVRFEDLIGPRGGGDRQKQLGTLRSIYDFLQMEAEEARIEWLAEHVFSSASLTFRRGSTSQWPQYFDDEMCRAFEEQAGALLARYGYQ